VVPAVQVYDGSVPVTTDTAVIIGGGEIGVETGMILAQQGKKVTILEMRERLAMDSTPVHFYSMFMEAWQKEENLSSICEAKCSRIADGGVYYIDKSGEEKFVAGGTVVIAAGMKSKSDLALSFAIGGPEFRAIGDCDKVGNVQKCMRAAFGCASTL
jgi:pyruvate/2-oxoglutarate dehydrogenase complex dihydrolipoamide dehydrogenase (E3) component